MCIAHDFKMFLTKFCLLGQNLISITRKWFSSYKKNLQSERDNLHEWLITYLK